MAIWQTTQPAALVLNPFTIMMYTSTWDIKMKNKVVTYSTITLQFKSPLRYTPEIKQFQNIHVSLQIFYRIEHNLNSIPRQHKNVMIPTLLLTIIHTFTPKSRVLHIGGLCLLCNRPKMYCKAWFWRVLSMVLLHNLSVWFRKKSMSVGS